MEPRSHLKNINVCTDTDMHKGTGLNAHVQHTHAQTCSHARTHARTHAYMHARTYSAVEPGSGVDEEEVASLAAAEKWA